VVDEAPDVEEHACVGGDFDVATRGLLVVEEVLEAGYLCHDFVNGAGFEGGELDIAGAG
jgi:hypothetical protein